MRKILSVLCITSLLVSGISAIPTMAEEIDEKGTETTNIERAAGYLSYHNTSVSNYNGSLCVNTINVKYLADYDNDGSINAVDAALVAAKIMEG